MAPGARRRSASRKPPRAVRGGSAPPAPSTSRSRPARPKKMSSSPDTSIAACTCASLTSTQQCPRGGAPPGLLGSRRRWSLVSWGGIGDVLDDELVLHVERPLDNRLPPCHTHTRTSESTVSDEHGQSRLRARAGYQRAVQRWARLEYQAHAEGPGVRVTRAGAGAVGRGSSQWPGGHGGLPGHLNARRDGLRGVARTSHEAATGTIGRPRPETVISGPERHRAAPIAAARSRREPSAARLRRSRVEITLQSSKVRGSRSGWKMA